MKITFDTKNKEEVAEVVLLLTQLSISGIAKGVEAKETEKTTPTIDEPKKDAEKSKKTPAKKDGKITLADLKESAKKAVGRSSREEVKTTIGEYAEKLAEVDEADYAELDKKLQELGA